MIYLSKPTIFNPQQYIVSCFVESRGRILLLHRQDYKPEGNTWGVPAGKRDKGEIPVKAMSRELLEETSIEKKSEQLEFFRKIYIKYGDRDFVYVIYHCLFNNFPAVRIREKEHKSYKWVTPTNALKVALIQDLGDCIKLYYKLK